MNVYKRLLVCEAMLARLDEALARADEELAHSNTLEERIQIRLTALEAEQQRIEQKLTDLKADLPTNSASAPAIKEPTRASPAFAAGSVLRELKAAQDQLMRSLEFHRPSAEVITVNFARKHNTMRPNLSAQEACGAA